jgi:hypothetical protein
VVAAVTECGGLEYAHARAQSFCASAEAALEALRPSPAREQLRSQALLVLSHAPADSRLADALRLGGGGETAQARRRFKAQQIGQK